ncbi:hypothetical protein [Phormidium yuhuli]|nr:hypothetical protein [Phormidium yuhuli]
MRAIHKGAEPTSLVAWKRVNPQKQYVDLTPDIRRDIREKALKE